jgi:hypothetical protein
LNLLIIEFYNLLSFIDNLSMLAKIDHSINAQPETYAFKINGYCHHVMGFLLPINNEAQSLLNYMFLTLRMRFIIGLSHLPRKTFRRP